MGTKPSSVMVTHPYGDHDRLCSAWIWRASDLAQCCHVSLGRPVEAGE